MTSQVSRNGIGWVAPSQTVRDLAARQPEGADAVSYFTEAAGTRYVVTGTYFRQGDRLIVQADVMDGATGELVPPPRSLQGRVRSAG